MSVLSVSIAVLGVLVSIYRAYFSAPAMLAKLQLKLESLKARQQVEAERLRATYARINAEPDRRGTDLANQLNKSVEDLRK